MTEKCKCRIAGMGRCSGGLIRIRLTPAGLLLQAHCMTYTSYTNILDICGQMIRG